MALGHSGAQREQLDTIFGHCAAGSVVIGLWWTATFGLARLFLRANRWAGGLMVPHVVYASYVSLAVWLTWVNG